MNVCMCVRSVFGTAPKSVDRVEKKERRRWRLIQRRFCSRQDFSLVKTRYQFGDGKSTRMRISFFASLSLARYTKTIARSERLSNLLDNAAHSVSSKEHSTWFLTPRLRFEHTRKMAQRSLAPPGVTSLHVPRQFVHLDDIDKNSNGVCINEWVFSLFWLTHFESEHFTVNSKCGVSSRKTSWEYPPIETSTSNH